MVPISLVSPMRDLLFLQRKNFPSPFRYAWLSEAWVMGRWSTDPVLSQIGITLLPLWAPLHAQVQKNLCLCAGWLTAFLSARWSCGFSQSAKSVIICSSIVQFLRLCCYCLLSALHVLLSSSFKKKICCNFVILLQFEKKANLDLSMLTPPCEHETRIYSVFKPKIS